MSERIKIPALGEKLLEWVIPDNRKNLLIGDFEEDFIKNCEEKGKRKAKLLFWIQFFASAPLFIRQSFAFKLLLLSHAISISVRNLRRHLGYSLLNLFGLSVGIACFVMIILYVQDENSYDRFHEKSDRIYRVLDFRKVDGSGEESSSAPTPLGERMLVDYPGQIESVVRFFNFQAPTLALAYQGESTIRQFNESRLYFVDQSFFNVFDFSLAEGDPATALDGPNKVIITSEMAKKYFDYDDPVGKILRFEDKNDFVVSGVFDELPTNSHLKFDFLVSFETLNNPDVLRTRLRNSWIWNPSWTYVLLKDGMEPSTLEAQFPNFVNTHFPESRRDRVKLYLQPLADIHLHSKLDYEMGPNSDVVYIYIFSTIAVFILLISCINFMNLVTARANTRFKEIGVRKVLGGNKKQIISQLLTESFFTSFLAILLAIPIIWLSTPFLNELTNKQLSFDLIQYPTEMLWLLIVFLFVGLLAGVYPAYFLSSSQPSQAIKGDPNHRGTSGNLFRKAMVVGQFCLSIILITGTIVAAKQFDFLQNRDLGFDNDKVVLLPTLRSPLMDKYSSFKQTLLQHSNIKALTTAEDIPGMKYQTGGYTPEGSTQELQFPRLIVHDDFAQTMGIEMAAGRGFDKSHPSDADDAIIINETMVKMVGWGSAEEAIGKSFDNEMVIGVVKDFHFASLHNPIGPFVLQRVGDDPSSLAFSARYIAVRIEGGSIRETLAFIEDQWRSFVPNTPYEYELLDSLLLTQYQTEATLGKLTWIFSALSILIACMGLFGLASFTAQRRIKEIGIRKVMGASTSGLVLMLSASFLKLVAIAVFLAWPVAYFSLDEWLQDFAYRTDLDIWPFAVSGALAIFIVFLTVSYHSIRVSLINPTDTLRDE